MFGANIVVLEALRFLLGKAQDFSGPFGELVKPIPVAHVCTALFVSSRAWAVALSAVGVYLYALQGPAYYFSISAMASPVCKFKATDLAHIGQGFSKKVVKCVPHPTPKGEKERGAARRATLFLSLFCHRRRPVSAEQCDFCEALSCCRLSLSYKNGIV